MSVRAIFYVEEVRIQALHGPRPAEGDIGTVKLRAAAKGPYKRWSQWTPSGSLELGTLNPAAFQFFRDRVGTDVAITFDDPTDADLVDDD